jgi:ferritin-like protein
MSNEKSEKSEMNETERKELVASKMKEFQQMMPNLMNSILPVATSISEQLTTDLSDIKKALSVIYRKQLELEKAINALQRQGT